MSEQLYICPRARQCAISECEHNQPHAHEYGCGWETCKDAPDKGQPTICVLFRETSHIAQVRIIMGNYWGSCFVTFRTQYDVDHNLTGRRYRNPSPEGLGRLSRLLYERAVPAFVDHQSGEIVFGDQTPLPGLFG